MIDATIDGQPVVAEEGATILDACRAAGIETPTLCYLDTLTPVNVCRVCVVDVEGSRALVPACSRPIEAGMVISTDNERVRHSRRLVLELLAEHESAPAKGRGTRGKRPLPGAPPQSAMPLFGGVSPEASRILAELRALDLDNLTPRQALDTLAELREQAGEE